MLNRMSPFSALALASMVGVAQAALCPTAPLTSPAPPPSLKEAPARSQLECVVGFSKDYCGTLTPITHPVTSACITPIPEGSCRTLRFVGSFNVSMTNNLQICGNTPDATCNETLHGSLDVSPKFLIRLQDNCPYRGCWEGDGVWTFRDGSTYRGSLMGTLGVGSHRPISSPTTCNVNGGRNCERCYDVSYDAHAGLWRIGFEASFHGDRSDAETGEEVCFTLSGDFFISGTDAGPNWANVWRVGGTADGIQLTFCP